jgi:hypothetical protein
MAEDPVLPELQRMSSYQEQKLIQATIGLDKIKSTPSAPSETVKDIIKDSLKEVLETDFYGLIGSSISPHLPDISPAPALPPITHTETTKPLHLTPNQICVTSSLMYPKYGVDPQSPDQLRGDLTLASVKHLQQEGYHTAIMVSKKTSPEFFEQFYRIADPQLSVIVREPTETYQGGYSADRRLALDQPQPVVLTCESEKIDLLRQLNKLIVQPFNTDPDLAMTFMDRGVMEHGNVANLPGEQFYGEYIQNLEITEMMIAAGFLPKGTRPLDLLNGTRAVRNEKLPISNSDRKVNPLDLMMVQYAYEPGFEDPTKYKFDIHFYTEAIYASVILAASLGLKVKGIPLQYHHPDEQRLMEENKDDWAAKRLAHLNTIPPQCFDIVANITVWRDQEVWPNKLLHTLETGEKLMLRHYDQSEYFIYKGHLFDKNSQSVVPLPTSK